jgi:hypothetical protein
LIWLFYPRCKPEGGFAGFPNMGLSGMGIPELMATIMMVFRGTIIYIRITGVW